eukprot:CAMPEP_0204445454 /NCGR_PEP_ID=MMETSP0470-20130426/92898_1 /ASSEMBLY_ACC=CAM_ASM_000385 /TAXON_ID=2969 /ORGANISM="Oxyrrhis marina" /LENGTH=125 /DNA_ID=CAMNT_0051444909 /DNA_START=213 /DNA_END=590 /DNA_ORIENTATION=-
MVRSQRLALALIALHTNFTENGAVPERQRATAAIVKLTTLQTSYPGLFHGGSPFANTDIVPARLPSKRASPQADRLKTSIISAAAVEFKEIQWDIGRTYLSCDLEALHRKSIHKFTTIHTGLQQY